MDFAKINHCFTTAISNLAEQEIEFANNVLSENKTIVGRTWDSTEGIKKIVAVKEFRGKEAVLVQTGDNQRKLDIIPVSEIESEIAFDTKRLKSNQRFAQQQQAIKDQEEKEHAEKTSLDGFEKTLSPKMQARAIKALTTRGIKSDGIFYKSIRDMIRAKVKSGYKVKGIKSEREFTSPRGGYFLQKDITKLGMDYAEYLIKKGKA